MIASCRTTIDLLPALIDHALAPEQHDAVHDHLAVCPRCVEFQQSYRATIRILRDATATEPPKDLEARLLVLLGVAPR
jgi:anti-sigma factor RsiW